MTACGNVPYRQRYIETLKPVQTDLQCQPDKVIYDFSFYTALQVMCDFSHPCTQGQATQERKYCCFIMYHNNCPIFSFIPVKAPFFQRLSKASSSHPLRSSLAQGACVTSNSLFLCVVRCIFFLGSTILRHME